MSFNSTIFAEILSFLIFYYLCSRFAFPSIERILDERKRRVAAEIEEARSQREQAEKQRAELEAELQRARTEAQAIIERAQRAAQAQVEEQVQAARAETERLLARAREEIEAERREVIRRIQGDVTDLSLDIARRVITSEIDEAKHRELISAFVSKLEAS